MVGSIVGDDSPACFMSVDKIVTDNVFQTKVRQPR
jgi:hypothetical protein